MEGNPLLSAPNAPACGRPAHQRLQPCPALGTRAPALGEGAGESSGAGVSDSQGRVGEEAILSSDPDLVRASRPGAENLGRRKTSRWGEVEGARGENEDAASLDPVPES